MLMMTTVLAQAQWPSPVAAHCGCRLGREGEAGRMGHCACASAIVGGDTSGPGPAAEEGSLGAAAEGHLRAAGILLRGVRLRADLPSGRRRAALRRLVEGRPTIGWRVPGSLLWFSSSLWSVDRLLMIMMMLMTTMMKLAPG